MTYPGQYHPDRPPPGWYTDPFGPPGSIRWWDGTGWTAATRYIELHRGGGEQPAPGGEDGPRRVIPARAAWWGLLGLGIGEILGGILALIAAAAAGDGNSAVVILMGEIGLWSGMVGACVLVSRRYGTGSVRRDFSARFRAVDLGWGVLVAVCGVVVTAVLSQAFKGTRLQGNNTQILGGQTHNTTGFVVVALIVSVGAPLVEELFFRGLLRTALAARLGAPGAVAAQAVLFGLAHFNPATGLGNVEVVAVISVFGAILGIAAQRTGRLGAGMIGHGLFNLLVTVSVLAS